MDRGFSHLAACLESVETAGDPCQIAGQARVRLVAALASAIASFKVSRYQSFVHLVLIAPIVRIGYMSWSCCPNRLDDGTADWPIKVVSRSTCQQRICIGFASHHRITHECSWCQFSILEYSQLPGPDLLVTCSSRPAV